MSALASGIYRYWRDGAPQSVTEPWRLLRSENGLLLRGKRLVDGLPFLDVEAEYVGARCTSLRLHWQPPAPAAPRGAEYRLEPGLLRWRFEHEAGWREQPLPADALLFPLLRAGTGPLLGLLAGGTRTVVLPCIRDANDHDTFLHPLSGLRHVTKPLAAGDAAPTLRYHGGEYGEQGCDCWLDSLGLLQRYLWPTAQGKWDVRLDELQHSETFTGFPA